MTMTPTCATGGSSMLAPVPDPRLNPMVPPPDDNTAAVRTVGVQTQFRESEAQTDPYTPDYLLPKNGAPDPEILALASLSAGAGRGLPAGLAEIQMIERARQKRECEAALPPMTDEACFELRKRLMVEQEGREWRVREEEIDRLQVRRATESAAPRDRTRARVCA